MTESITERMIKRRDAERAGLKESLTCVSPEDTVLEVGPQGTIRWYMHPEIPNRCVNNVIVYQYEIEPGSATGKQRIQGNVVSYVISGHGYSLVDGDRHDWKAGDAIGLPVRHNGIEFQHFNDGTEVAILITAEPNWLNPFGVDLGSGFEQLERAPGVLHD